MIEGAKAPVYPGTLRGTLPLTTTAPLVVRDRMVPRSWLFSKRAIDIVLGAAALAVTAPVITFAAVAIACVSPGSPFFTQERVGRGGKRFKLFKLRTMIDGAHLQHQEMQALSEVDGPVLKIRNDPRIRARPNTTMRLPRAASP
jgi:lipopolysaccharide/colanic/teichoic acid biosynthesis glycosyltransferase